MVKHILRNAAGAVVVISVLLAQTGEVERFDLGGMPSKATTFVEQQIQEMIQSHRRGDAQDAVLIQRKLSGYYAARGDTVRARIAADRAELGEQMGRGLSRGETNGPSRVTNGQTPQPIPLAWEACEARN